MHLIKLILVALLFFSEPLFSAPAWYFGEVDRVWRNHSDAFVITVSSNELDDCEHGYAYFDANRLGREHFDGLYSMALTAFVSNQRVSMVIDKELDAPKCYVKSMDMRK